jgi:hypothetical protein
LREQRLSAGEIVQLLSDEGVDISVRTVKRILAEEGFSKLPRRTKLTIGLCGHLFDGEYGIGLVLNSLLTEKALFN